MGAQLTKFPVKISFQGHDLLKKLACLFAGLGHLQPLLLATTNSHYLLDRFCMERCCSGEYISRIVTSIIFMEIISIIVVRIVLYVTLRCFPDWSDETSPGKLVKHNEDEVLVRDIISIAILWAIFLGYIQIFHAFVSGGKKGHMEWFYASLLIQHFLNSLIAGSIGFWEVGRALWYLVTLPMGPIVVFFYQLYIHSWIRNGPRYPERLIVEWQIILALILSGIATIFWTAGYLIPLFSYQAASETLTLPAGSPGNIKKEEKTIKVYTLTGTQEIKSANTSVKVTIKSITVTGGTPEIVRPNRVVALGTVDTAGTETKITISKTVDTVTVKIENPVGEAGETPLYNGPGTDVKIALAGSNLSNINATGDSGTPATVTGYTYFPDSRNYINQTSVGTLWNEKWDGGKCFYAEYYKNTSGSHALLKLCILGNTLTTRYYGTQNSGTNWYELTSTVFSTKLDELQRTGQLSVGSSDGTAAEDQSNTQNTDFTKVLCNEWSWDKLSTWAFKDHSATWFPLLMQGLSVGAVGSIFPNLIPKTLVCGRTTRTLSVINMFLVTVPHIFNVMLGDMDLLGWIGVGAPWDDTGHAWTCSLLLYLIYGLAILFAIFNIHYPEWRLSTFLRNNTWFVFLMILFTDVLNESRWTIVGRIRTGTLIHSYGCYD